MGSRVIASTISSPGAGHIDQQHLPMAAPVDLCDQLPKARHDPARVSWGFGFATTWRSGGRGSTSAGWTAELYMLTAISRLKPVSTTPGSSTFDRTSMKLAVGGIQGTSVAPSIGSPSRSAYPRSPQVAIGVTVPSAVWQDQKADGRKSLSHRTEGPGLEPGRACARRFSSSLRTLASDSVRLDPLSSHSFSPCQVSGQSPRFAHVRAISCPRLCPDTGVMPDQEDSRPEGRPSEF